MLTLSLCWLEMTTASTRTGLLFSSYSTGDLALAVRAQIAHLAVLAHLGQALGQLVGQADGHGHQLRGLVAGITEHHALVAGTAHLVVGAQAMSGLWPSMLEMTAQVSASKPNFARV